MNTFCSFLADRLRAFKNFEAWFMIVLGLLLYTSRTPMPEIFGINLPMTMTVIQVSGLMFMLCGFQTFISILMFPNVNLRDLLERTENGNTSAGIAAGGLLMFNGFALLAQVLWLIYGTGARVGA